MEISSLTRVEPTAGLEQVQRSVFIYRDVFVILAGRGEAAADHGYAAEDARISKSSKQLIDLRFPQK